MNDKDNASNNKSMNKSKNPISSATQKNYNIRIKYLEIKDYTNIDKVSKQID